MSDKDELNITCGDWKLTLIRENGRIGLHATGLDASLTPQSARMLGGRLYRMADRIENDKEES